MWSDRVVVEPPDGQSFANMAERGEQCLVHQFVAQAAEALHEGSLRRPARCPSRPPLVGVRASSLLYLPSARLE